MITEPINSSLILSEVLAVLQRSDQVISHSHELSALSPSTMRATLHTDSRRVVPGSIFLAYRGVSSDGHKHIGDALGKGAAMIVLEDKSLMPPHASAPYIEVKSGRFAWAFLAAEAFGNPQQALQLLAVTGTNGKTSTAWMVHSLLKANGIPSLLIGTLGAWLGDKFYKTNHTTPDPDLLYALLAEAKDAGISTVIMEAASQSLLHGKLAPIKFCAAAFTSFSRDHLDLHGSIEEYFAAKWMLFEKQLTPDARVAISSAVPIGQKWELLPQHDLWLYKKGSGAAVASPAKNSRVKERTYKVKNTGPDGTFLALFDDSSPGTVGKIPYAGDFFVENFCAALLLTEKVAGKAIPPTSWEGLPPVPGRLEWVQSAHSSTRDPRGPHVVVDYAHTPDALEKAIAAIRPLTKGRLIVVFGCGGDRDRGKRPEMGSIAARLADFTYVTSDNPRTEEPSQIIEDIVQGMHPPGTPSAAAKNFATFVDR